MDVTECHLEHVYPVRMPTPGMLPLVKPKRGQTLLKAIQEAEDAGLIKPGDIPEFETTSDERARMLFEAKNDWLNRTQRAIELAIQYGGIDGAHHKDWVIDQMVRVLAGANYDNVVARAKAGTDGHDTYDWHVGIAP